MQKSDIVCQCSGKAFSRPPPLIHPSRCPRFDTSNTEQLFEQLSEEEKQRFNFDIRSIDWHRYIAKVHLPGLRKFVLKGRGS